MKTCTKCKLEKTISEFNKSSKVKSGLRSSCRECDAQWNRQHYELNKERIQQKHAEYRMRNPDQSKEYYMANREIFCEKARINYLENREKKREYAKEYYVENPDIIAACRSRRRARKYGTNTSHTAADIRNIFEKQRGLCASCTKKLSKSGKNKFHVDHIMPLSRGGSNGKENIQCLCPECNLKKHAKDPLDWAKQNWRLL